MWVRWILRLVASRDRVAAVLGDIEEDLAARRAAGRPPRWPSVWIAGQTVAYAGALLSSDAGRGVRVLGRAARDGVRALTQSPGSTAFLLLVLTLAIAAATVTFSVVDAVVLRSLPFDRSNEIVVIRERTERGTSPIVPPQEYLAWRNGAPAFVSLAGVRLGSDTIPFGADTETILSARVTANLFDVLRARPRLGRLFTAGNEVPGADHVAVIGYGLWQRRFGGDPDAVGRTVRLQNLPYVIVGVMPEGFSYPVELAQPFEVWTPYAMTAEERAPPQHGLSSYVNVVGRLAPGTTPTVATSQLEAALLPLTRTIPNLLRDSRPEVVPLLDSLVGEVRGWMLLVLAAVALVLVIACVNVANVLLGRASSRAQALAIRAALGASRRELLAAVFAESLMLSLASAALGLLLALWGVGAAKAALPPGLARASDTALDFRVFIASIAAATVTGLLAGVLPAISASRVDVVALIKEGSSPIVVGGRRWRGALLVGEVAFAGVLLVATTLFVASFVRVSLADLGFDRSNLISLSATWGFQANPSEALDRLRAVPGVASVAALSAGSPPLIAAAFNGGSAGTRLSRPDAPDVRPVAVEFRNVSPDYFVTARIPLLRGRLFTASDGSAASHVVVIDETAARQLFGDRDPVGATVGVLNGSATVAGVVADVRMAGPEVDADAEVYVPMPQGPRMNAQFLLRTTAPAASVVPAVRAAALALHPVRQAAPTLYVLTDAFRRITAQRRFNAGLMSLFGILALLIGAAGVYGVMASIVAQRTRECGVRLALGATAGRIAEAMLGEAARYLVAGLAIGLAAGWWTSRAFATLLFAVRPTDWLVYVVVAGLVVTVGLAAAVGPARRAGRADPIAVLKSS